MALRIITGKRRALAYFESEYGPSAVESSTHPQLEVYIAGDGSGHPALQMGPPDCHYKRRHKVTCWRMAIWGLEEETTRVLFSGRGPMTLPYLQAFYIEPLLRLKMLEASHTLVHGCSLIKGETSVLLTAGSSVGKTTLLLTHAASGGGVQGDNYVILSPEGKTYAIPRRLRVYSDLTRTAEEAYRRLPLSARMRLRFTGLVKRLSLGYANPASRLRLDQLTRDVAVHPSASLASIFVLTPHSGSELVGPTPLILDEVVSRVQEHSASEAVWLTEVLAPYLDAHRDSQVLRAASIEKRLLEQAFKGLPSFEIRVPRVADPGRLAREIIRACGLDPDPHE